MYLSGVTYVLVVELDDCGFEVVEKESSLEICK